jgi:hypothetical protein
MAFDPKAFLAEHGTTPAESAPAEPIPQPVAFQAQAVPAETATQALDLADKVGLHPQFVADNLDEVAAAQKQKETAAKLDELPVTKAFASQSAPHAAAVQKDLGYLEALELGLGDIGYGLIATATMSGTDRDTEMELSGYEQAAEEAAKKHSDPIADILRAAPSLALYYSAGMLGKVEGGKVGEFAATAATMYALNRGSLYRQIMHNMPIPRSDAEGVIDPVEYELRARKFSMLGATASATVGAGLGVAVGGLGDSVKIQMVTGRILARVFSDPDTFKLAARLVGIGDKTLTGALMMAAPAIVDNATVQKAVRGEVDMGEAVIAGWQAFKVSLLAAGVLSTLPKVKALAHDVGAIATAPVEAAKLDAAVQNAQALSLPPAHAEEVIGQQAAQGEHQTVFIHPDALKSPEVVNSAVGAVGAQVVQEAKATQGDLVMPIEKYAVRMGEHHEAIKDKVKLTADGITPGEVPDAKERALDQASAVSAPLDPKAKNLPAWAREMMIREGQDPNRPLNDFDIADPNIQAVIKLDPTLSDEQKTNLLSHGSPLPKAVKGLVDTIQKVLSPPEPQPGPPRQKMLESSAEAIVSGKPIGEIQPAAYSRAAERAGTGAAEAHGAAIESLARAEGKAQEGISAGLSGIDSAQKGIREYDRIKDAEWAKGLRSSIETGKLADVRRTINELLRQATAVQEQGGKEATFAREQADVLKSIKRTVGSGQKWLDALKYKTEPPNPDTAAGGLYDAGGSRSAEGAPRPGTPEFIAGQDQEIKFSEGEMARDSAAAERARLVAESKSVAATREAVRAGTASEKAQQLLAAHDLNMALAKKAAEIRAEMDKHLDSIKTAASSQKARAELGLAHPAFRDVFDSLVDSIGVRKAPAVENRRGLVDLLQQMPLVGFDEVAIQRQLDNPRPWNKLTPPEARQIADAITSIRKTAQRMNQIATSDKVQSFQDFRDKAAEENAGRKDLGSPALTRSAENWLQRKVFAKAGLLSAENLMPETVFDTLGKTFHSLFTTTIDARNAKQKLQGDVLRYFEETVGKLDWLHEPVETTLKLPEIGDELKRQPAEEGNRQMRSRPLPELLAKREGGTAEEWTKLLSGPETINDLPALKEMVEQGKKDLAASKTVQRVPDLAPKMNKETLAMAFLHLGSEGNEQRLLSGLNWDGQEVRREIGRLLTPAQCEQLQAINTYFEKALWPQVRDHAEAVTGLQPKKVQARSHTIEFADGTVTEFPGGYFPAKPHPDALNVQGRILNGTMDQAAARATVNASFTKERAQEMSYPLDMNFSHVGQHINSVLHYLTYDQPVRDISRVLNDPNSLSIIRHSVGDAHIDQLQAWVDLMARGRVDSSGVWGISNKAGSVLRSTAVSRALGFKLSVALMQESHIPFAALAGEVSAKNASIAITRQIPYSDAWNASHAASTELQFRSTRYAPQLKEALSGGKMDLSDTSAKAIERAAFVHMEAADAHVSHVIFDAAYMDATDAGMSHADAVEAANLRVRRLMPTHNIFEMAPLVRSPGVIGAIMLFRGLPNIVGNVGYRAYDKARQSWAQVGKPQLASGATVPMQEESPGVYGVGDAAKQTSISAARVVAAQAALSVLGYLFAGHGKDREDDQGGKKKGGLAGWARWGERLALEGQLEALGPVKEVAAPIIQAAVDNKSVGWAMQREIDAQPEIATALTLVKDVGTVFSKHAKTPDRVQKAADAATMILAPALKPAVALGRYAYDRFVANRSRAQSRGAGDTLGAVMYQGNVWEKNIPTAVQDLISGEKPLPKR